MLPGPGLCMSTHPHTYTNHLICVPIVFSSPLHCLIHCYMIFISGFQASSHRFSCPVLSRDALWLIFYSRVYSTLPPFHHESSLALGFSRHLFGARVRRPIGVKDCLHYITLTTHTSCSASEIACCVFLLFLPLMPRALHIGHLRDRACEVSISTTTLWRPSYTLAGSRCATPECKPWLPLPVF
jgi:hypothetical protein